MTELIISGSLAVLVLGFIIVYARKELARYSSASVIVTDRRKATYFPGKQGEKVPPALADEIYERDDYRCQYPGCTERVYKGIANTRTEHIQGLAGAEPGNINHRFIPFYYGGPAIPENLEVMCQAHNIKRGKKIPRASFRWLAERGETIFLNQNDLLN